MSCSSARVSSRKVTTTSAPVSSPCRRSGRRDQHRRRGGVDRGRCRRASTSGPRPAWKPGSSPRSSQPGDWHPGASPRTRPTSSSSSSGTLRSQEGVEHHRLDVGERPAGLGSTPLLERVRTRRTPAGPRSGCPGRSAAPRSRRRSARRRPSASVTRSATVGRDPDAHRDARPWAGRWCGRGRSVVVAATAVPAAVVAAVAVPGVVVAARPVPGVVVVAVVVRVVVGRPSESSSTSSGVGGHRRRRRRRRRHRRRRRWSSPGSSRAVRRVGGRGGRRSRRRSWRSLSRIMIGVARRGVVGCGGDQRPGDERAERQHEREGAARTSSSVLMTSTILPRWWARSESAMRGLSSIRRQRRPDYSGEGIMRRGGTVFVPFSVSDFIDRAVQVYGDRTGVVDEPDQPAPSLGDADLRRDRRPRPPPGRPPRRARHRRRRPGRGGQPQQRPAAHVVLRRLRLRPGAGAGQLPAPARRGRATSSSTPAPGCCYVDPELDDALADVEAEHRFVLGDDDDLYAARGRRAAAVGAGRERHRDASTTPPAPRPGPRACRSRTATSGPTRSPSRCTPGVTDRDVYLHTLPMFHANGWGMPFAMTGLGVPAGRAAQGRRRRDPAPGREARRDRDVRGPGGRRGGARGRADLGGRDPRPRTGSGSSWPARRRRRRPSCRVEEELGWEFIQIYGLTETSPLLTVNRTRAEWDDLPAEERAPEAGPRRRAGARRTPELEPSTRTSEDARRGAGPLQRRARGLLGAAGGVRERRSRTAGSTPATAA